MNTCHENSLYFLPVHYDNPDVRNFKRLLSADVDNKVKSELPRAAIDKYTEATVEYESNLYLLKLSDVSIGFIEFTFDSCYVTNMAHLINVFVLEEYRGMGYGSEAVNFFKEAVKREPTMCYASVDCTIHNKEFYEKNGFEEDVWLTKTCLIK